MHSLLTLRSRAWCTTTSPSCSAAATDSQAWPGARTLLYLRGTSSMSPGEWSPALLDMHCLAVMRVLSYQCNALRRLISHDAHCPAPFSALVHLSRERCPSAVRGAQMLAALSCKQSDCLPGSSRVSASGWQYAAELCSPAWHGTRMGTSLYCVVHLGWAVDRSGLG